MHIYLKVKIKTLADEAVTIRKLEKKTVTNARQRKRMARAVDMQSVHGGDHRVPLKEAEVARLEKKLLRARARANDTTVRGIFWGLRNHRTNEVRKEARSSLIAYGFLRGLRYHQVEQSNKPVDWDRVEALIKKYGEDDIRERMQRFSEWVDQISN